MRKPLYLLISLIFLASCEETKYNCVELKLKEKIKTEVLMKTTDSITELRNLAWKQKEEAKKKGIIIGLSFESEILFKQNCFSNSDLKPIYNVIGSMIKHKEIKVRIIGNSDFLENKNKPNISLKRAEYIQSIFLQNGINKNRIEILDAKAERPNAQQFEKGNKYNRRVNFEVITE